MKIDLRTFNNGDDAAILFFLDEFKTEKDYIQALIIIEMIAADFSMAPEMEVKDLQEIVQSTKNMGKEYFTFEINEEGLEVDI